MRGRVRLQTGDLIVGYTDGVSEAMNASDEEFGEERMIAAVADAINGPPPAIIERLMIAADAFVAGAPQHDDMTLVVLKST